VVKSDSVAPGVSVADPGANLRGTLAVAANAADAVSGVASVRLERAPAGSSTWTLVGTDTTAPWSIAFDTTSVPDGLYDLRAVATDAAGNETTSAPAAVRVDNTAPTGSLSTTQDASAVHLSMSPSDDGSGIGSVTFEQRPTGGAWSTIGGSATPPYATDWSLGGVAPGSYEVRAVVLDQAGNAFVTEPSAVEVTAAPTPPPSSPPSSPFTFGTGKPSLSARGARAILSIPIELSARATINATLFKGRKTIRSWRTTAGPGKATLKLTVAKRLLKRGVYTLRLTATSASGRATKSFVVRVPARLRAAKQR
jgi:hypothetical protein